jgi:hypothetical protein
MQIKDAAAILQGKITPTSGRWESPSYQEGRIFFSVPESDSESVSVSESDLKK